MFKNRKIYAFLFVFILTFNIVMTPIKAKAMILPIQAYAVIGVLALSFLAVDTVTNGDIAGSIEDLANLTAVIKHGITTKALDLKDSMVTTGEDAYTVSKDAYDRIHTYLSGITGDTEITTTPLGTEPWNSVVDDAYRYATELPLTFDDGAVLDFELLEGETNYYNITINGVRQTYETLSARTYTYDGVELRNACYMAIHAGYSSSQETVSQKPRVVADADGLKICSQGSVTSLFSPTDSQAWSNKTTTRIVTKEQVQEDEQKYKTVPESGVTIPKSVVEDLTNGTATEVTVDGTTGQVTDNKNTTTDGTTTTTPTTTSGTFMENFWTNITTTLKTLFIPDQMFLQDQFVILQRQVEAKFEDMDAKIDMIESLAVADVDLFGDITINTNTLYHEDKAWADNTVVILSAKTVNDNISTIRLLTSMFWMFLLAVYTYNQLYFLIRGTYPIKMGNTKTGGDD